MEQYADKTLFDMLREQGPVITLFILFSIVCTAWLVISRIRRCFRVQAPNTVRDLAFLSTGPVAAVLTSICRAAMGIYGRLQPGLGCDWYLLDDLKAIAAVCSFGIICFIVGVISIMLPVKTDGKIT